MKNDLRVGWRKTTFETYMRLPAFRAGCMDAFLGEPFPASYERLSKAEQIYYEHGRQFGVLSKFAPPSRRKIDPKILSEFAWHFKSGAILC